MYMIMPRLFMYTFLYYIIVYIYYNLQYIIKCYAGLKVYSNIRLKFTAHCSFFPTPPASVFQRSSMPTSCLCIIKCIYLYTFCFLYSRSRIRTRRPSRPTYSDRNRRRWPARKPEPTYKTKYGTRLPKDFHTQPFRYQEEDVFDHDHTDYIIYCKRTGNC